MRTTVLRSLLLTGALAGILGLGPLPAAAAPPRATVVPCGAVLTTSVRLAADVTCPDGRGIVLAADGIELNLNGHGLTGPGTAPGPVGVRITAEDVVVRNGRISGWSSGVAAGGDVDSPTEPEPTSGTLREVRLDGNRVGVEALDDGDLLVRGSRLDGNAIGGSAFVDGGLVVEDSVVERNTVGLRGFANDDGEFVVRDSLVRSNGTGLRCDQDADITVVATTVQRNGVGLGMDQCSGVVERSRFVWNTAHLQTYLLEQDVLDVACTSFTRDGGPVTVPVRPC